MHPFERTVLRGCRRLVEPGQRVVVACSGGPDSSALLAALVALKDELGLAEIVAAHLDHGIRGDAARADAEATVAFARVLGVEVVTGKADAPAELVLRGRGSLEAAARAVRYRFLAEVARARGAHAVALGHTADDQAETVLLRLLRGAGLAGISGMPRRRALAGSDARVIRPLLRARRSAVLAYLAARGLPSVDDASNRDRRFLRNRIRHDVLPLLRAAANPAADDALLRLAEQARRARRHLDREARSLLALSSDGTSGWRVEVLATADPAVQAAALQRIVRRFAPDRAAAVHVEALLRVVRRGQGEVALPGGARLAIEGGLLVTPHAPLSLPAVEPIALPIPGEVLDPDAGLVFSTRIAPFTGDPNTDPAALVLLDADRVEGALSSGDGCLRQLAVRRRRTGDRFWPLGAPGNRTLKRFFNDRKVPRPERASVPVVTLDDRPVWIVGHRIDERYKVTPSTRRVLSIEARQVSRGDASEGRRP